MIFRLRILMAKELRQHFWVFIAMAVTLGSLGLIRWFSALVDPRATSPLSSVATVVAVTVPLCALILGHRIVVREYQGHAQLFLETLPLRRWEMVVAKYAVGLLALGSVVLAFVLAMALEASERSPHFLSILAVRSLGYVAPVWSLCFSMGFFGRLRVAAYLTLLFGVVLLQRTTAFDLGRFGPLALIDQQTFAFERGSVPFGALGESLALSLLFVGLGLGLSLVSEGSFAERLSRRMSPREVVAISVLLMGELILARSVQARKRLAPFELTGEAVLRGPTGHAEVMYAWPELAPRSALALEALSELGANVERELGVAKAPVLRVAHNTALERREVRDTSSSSSGVLLEVNLGAADFDLQRLLESAAHSSFVYLSRGRAAFEPNHWFLDGFSTWWTSERRPELADVHWQRALAASRRVELGAGAVTHWERLMDATGESGAHALAFTMVELLVERHGREAVVLLARDLLASPTVSDVASWLAQRDATLVARIEALTGGTWPAFVADWSRAFAARGAQLPPHLVLAQRGTDRAQVRLEPSSIGVDIVYSLTGPALSTDRACAILSTKLPPFDHYVSPLQAERREVLWRAGESRVEGRWRGKYQRGERAWAAVECAVPELAAELRLASARLEAP